MQSVDRAEYLELRRAIINSEYGFLNERQRSAVCYTEGPLLVLAGAGSGKTTVLINRISNILRFGGAYESDEFPTELTYEDIEWLRACLEDKTLREERRLTALLAEDPAPPWSILAITFTNKAAKEMKERLERSVGPAAEDIWASTFHSSCMRILRRDCERLGYSRNFTVYDDDDGKSIVKECLKQMNLDDRMFPPQSVLAAISRAKEKLLDPGQFRASVSGDFRMEKIAEIYERYQKKLFEASAFDFDDLIMQTVLLLQKHEDVLSFYHRKFRYVLIDEYQDTNHAQYMLASLLAGGHKNLCVVGDDDQSIYRFRGATIENILNFEKQYKNARVVRLEQNYRSTQTILDAANAVIKNNLGRKGKTLWTENGEGDPITLYTAENEQDESGCIASQILAGLKNGFSLRDHAVLYRMNAQSQSVERAFQRSGIPYRIVGGTRYFDRAEVKDMLAYLYVINNPADTLRLRRIVNTPARGIGARSVEIASQLAEREGITLFEVLSKADSFPELARSCGAMKKFADKIAHLIASVGTFSSIAEFYTHVLELSGYLEMLEEKPSEENRTRAENAMELKTNIAQYEKDNPEGTLSGFLEEVALFTDLDRYDQGEEAVSMMTLHSVKGLEFPVVFICGFEEGLFPGMRSTELEDIEEERRLAYVGITRAKKKLYLLHAKTRMLFGFTQYNSLSRFVREIPPEYMDLSDSVAISSPVHRDYPSEPKPVHRPSPTAARPSPSPSAARTRPTAQPASRPAVQPSSSAPLPNLRTGMMVEHRLFGRGMILSANPTGNDLMLEVAFDKVGTKVLLARAAMRLMKILD